MNFTFIDIGQKILIACIRYALKKYLCFSSVPELIPNLYLTVQKWFWIDYMADRIRKRKSKSRGRDAALWWKLFPIFFDHKKEFYPMTPGKQINIFISKGRLGLWIVRVTFNITECSHLSNSDYIPFFTIGWTIEYFEYYRFFHHIVWNLWKIKEYPTSKYFKSSFRPATFHFSQNFRLEKWLTPW